MNLRGSRWTREELKGQKEDRNDLSLQSSLDSRGEDQEPGH